MITWEKLLDVNEKMPTIDIEKKGKDGTRTVTQYAMVKDRVAAFRELCPCGSITTDILSLANGVVTIKATVSDEDGNILGTGIAQEKEGNGFINKDSFVPNCETSAIGRALGNCGIGASGSYASAEEVANAIKNQGERKERPVTDKEKACLVALSESIGIHISDILASVGVEQGERMSRAKMELALDLIGDELIKRSKGE